MSLQSGPVITSQGVLINSHMKQAAVERASGDYKWHSHIPHRDHITLCTVSVQWTTEAAENVMRVFDLQSERGKRKLICYQCITVSEMRKKSNPKQAYTAEYPVGRQQHRNRWINCFTWWRLCASFSIPDSWQSELQTLWVRSPQFALAASLSIFSLWCKPLHPSEHCPPNH